MTVADLIAALQQHAPDALVGLWEPERCEWIQPMVDRTSDGLVVIDYEPHFPVAR